LGAKSKQKLTTKIIQNAMLCLPTPQKKRKPKMIYDKGAGEKKGGKTKRKPKQIKQEH